jgi:hypothetical protein
LPGTKHQITGLFCVHTKGSAKNRKEDSQMAIQLTFEYGKRLGLPGYSSHTFGVTAKAEVNDPTQIAHEAARMYQVLQDSVDSQIINEGFIPGGHGREIARHGTQDAPGHQSEGNVAQFPGNTRQGATQAIQDTGAWMCSPKQKELILKIMDENQLPAGHADGIAVELHGKPMSGLTKLEASGVVSEFLARYRRRRNGTDNTQHGGAR